MSERYEPYVTDPAEPPRRPRLAGLRPAVWTLVLLILVIGAATLYLQGRGEDDPALQEPARSQDS